MNRPRTTGARKREHIELCLSDASSFQSRSNGLEDFALVHDALPEVDFEAIELNTEFLGHDLRVPLIISSMTGGTEEAARLNRVLATGAQDIGCAMGVGSQRAALEDADVVASYHIRDVAPDVPIFGNLGAVQLNYGFGAEECMRAVEMIEADGLFLHLNSLQEVLQPEGDGNFAGLVDKIESLCVDLPFPVLLKTTGNGLSRRSASKLVGLDLAGLEVSGAGGTSWARIEALRSGDEQALAHFAEWGESTAESLVSARAVLPELPLIASGGIRDGVDVAKALALGANLVGMARPLLQAAHEGPEALDRRLEAVSRQLRISCFYCGRERVEELSAEDLRFADGGGNLKSLNA